MPICQPVRCARLAAPAVHGAEPMAVATLNPLPNELSIREMAKKLIFASTQVGKLTVQIIHTFLPLIVLHLL